MERSIVIDREYGSGGREVARLVSEKLGIPWYDGSRLLEAAEEFGFDVSLVEDYDEEGVGRTISQLGRPPRYSPEGRIIDRAYLAYEERRRLMVKLSQKGSCIFLGRCADEALKDKVPCLRVFVYASDPAEKEERSRTVDGIEGDTVEAYIQKKDTQRRRYYNSFTGREWGSRENYDLCLNTSALGYDLAAECVAAVWRAL